MAIYPETDRTMLERIISGDDVSWQDFYQRYSPVVRLLCRAAHLPDDCHDDIVQTVMSRFSCRTGRYLYTPERAKFRTYFNRIVRAAIADEFRKNDKIRMAKEATDISEFAADPQWEQVEWQTWRSTVMQEALHELSTRVSSTNFVAFTMTALEGRSVRETAEFLKISRDQVYQARSRCSATLKEIVARCNAADPELHLSETD